MTLNKLNLTFACGPYDRMQPLYEGAVGIEGVEIVPRVIQFPVEIFSRMLKNDEFDIAEMSLTHCYTLSALGKARFVTLPVFPSRMFRHGFIFVNRRAGIRTPKDLEGRRIGVQGYQMTAAVWIRGILAREYGVSFEHVRWLEGGVNQPGVAGGEAMVLRPDAPLAVEHIGEKRTLSDMLAAREIDALIGAFAPLSLRTSPDVVRLFPDFHQREREYYRRTGVHPIMHALVMRAALHAQHPRLAQKVYEACVAAKDVALRQARFSGAPRYMLPWLYEHLDEMDEVFGDDPWPYGLARNLPTLQAFAQLLAEQRLLPRPPRLEDVFVPVGEGGSS